MKENNQDAYLKQWQYIPQEAFRYFPSKQEIKIGEEEKQWRKIFENGEEYEEFQTNKLIELEKKLIEKNIVLDPWFDKANKLRFLQANKFKVSNTVQSMQETTKWRSTSFPIQENNNIRQMLNSGAFYFCGRDNKYRPIIVADIGKFNADDVETIPQTLCIIMEFMLKQLLIQGQVQNYVLIMNLQQASFGLRKVITKILSFTSNAYRGRLFVSYLLSMPSLLKFGWDALVSNFVSQNTLKKINITGKSYNDDMWSHISKDTIQEQYGGRMKNMTKQYWPPKKELMIATFKQNPNNLISPEQYKRLYEAKKLLNRKIWKKHVYVEPTILKAHTSPTNNENIRITNNIKQKSNQQYLQMTKKTSKSNLRNSQKNNQKHVFKKETPITKQGYQIKTFFQSQEYRNISYKIKI